MERSRRRTLTERQLSRRNCAAAINEAEHRPLVNQESPPTYEKITPEVINRKFSDTGLRIVNGKNDVVITIPKHNIKKLNVYDLAMSIQMMTNPLFIDRINVAASSKAAPYSAINPVYKKGMPHVAIFMNTVRHYSGGRYHAMMLCKVLAMIGCRVTLVTESIPPFISDFKFIDDGGRISYRMEIDETVWLSKCDTNDFDLVIATPVLAGVHGFNYAKKWKLPVYMMIYETPNYISQYRGGLDSGEGYWHEYKMCLIQCDKIICLANVPMQEARRWLTEFNIPESRFSFLYPMINSYIADKIPEMDEKEEITFVGRHVDFKNPAHIIEAVGRIKNDLELIPSINFIGTHNDATRMKLLDAADKYGITIRFYANVNDEEKYAIIKRSKMLCCLAVFEGFGIVPAEGLYCEKPVIVYDIPVIREVYGNCVEYAPQNDIRAVSKQILHLLKDEQYRREKGKKGKEHILKTVHPMVFANNVEKMILGDTLSISVGMIVLNGADTILHSLRSIYDVAKEILIVEGAVDAYAKINPEMVNENGGSVDNTIELINTFPDPQNKIKLLSFNKFYKHKMEMQNIIAENVTGDIYLKVDSDEIYKRSDIEMIRSKFRLNPKLTIFKYKFNHFWHNLDTIAVGGQWESKMVRCWRWRKDFRHPENSPTGFNYFYDKDGKKVADPDYVVEETNERLVYHLNYAVQSEAKVKAKINYYMKRGIETGVNDTWSNWEQGHPTNPTHPTGTTSEKFIGSLPIVLQNIKLDKITGKERIDHNVTLMASPVIRKADNVKWTVGIIVVNGDQFARENIQSLLQWKDLQKLVVVEGADTLYPRERLTKDGLSTDKTADIIRKLKSKKLEFVQAGFQENKQALRNVYLDRAEGSHLLVVDIDEFYTKEDLDILTDEVAASHESIIQWEFIRDRVKEDFYGGIVHFWHTLKHRIVGGYYSIPHQRIYKLQKGMKYTTSHNHPTLRDGVRIDQLRHQWSTTSIKCYHAGFMLDPANMNDKQQYYANRGEKTDRPMYTRTRELWFNWDKKTLEYPIDGIKILEYKDKIPPALDACKGAK